jgi:hypothetical protein
MNVFVIVTHLLMCLQGDTASLKGTRSKMESRSNVTGGAPLAPGINPSSAMGILKTGDDDVLDKVKDHDTTCLRGLPNNGHTVCCSPVCWTCSRTEECNAPTTPQEHKDNCCPGSIVAAEKSCDENMAPCKLNPSFTMQWKTEQTLPITEKRHERNVARVKQREFRATLFYECAVKYDFAVDLAANVRKLSKELVVEANVKASEYRAKLAGKDSGPNDAMRRFTWENEVESNEDKARFYGMIERNAQWVYGNGTEGLEKIDVMKVEIQTKIELIHTYKAKVDTLHDDSIRVYKDAEMLWKQWQDSAKTYNCSPLPLVDNHEEMCKQPNTLDRRCPIKCELGYDGEGTRNSLRCIKQGDFGKQLFGELTGVASCLGRSCGTPPIIAQASVISQEIRYPKKSVVCLRRWLHADWQSRWIKGIRDAVRT